MKPKKIIFLSLLAVAAVITSCKNDTDITPDEQVKFTLDGKSYSVKQGDVQTVLYQDAGDPVSALDIVLPLDAANSLKFFIADLKTGTITLTPKTGAKIKSLTAKIAQADNTTQTYVQHSSGATNFFAKSGTITLTSNETTGDFNYQWDVTFKDDAGKEYKSTGETKGNTGKAAKKAKNQIVDPTPTAGTQSTMVIFVDTAALYKFNIDGNGKVKISSEVQNSTNSYIASASINPVTKRIFYLFTPKYDQDKTLYSMKADGTDKKTIKTILANEPLTNYFSFGGKLVFNSKYLYNGTTEIATASTMEEDGTNEQRRSGWMSFDLAAASGTKLVKTGTYSDNATQNCYIMVIKDWVFDEAHSFSVKIPGKTINKFTISNDGNKMACLSQIPMTDKWDVYVIDISKKDGENKKIGTWTAPQLPTQPNASAAFPIDIYFAHGSSQLVIQYDFHKNYNQGGAYPDDYIMLEFYDTANFAKVNSWKIMGKYTGSILID